MTRRTDRGRVAGSGRLGLEGLLRSVSVRELDAGTQPGVRWILRSSAGTLGGDREPRHCL